MTKLTAVRAAICCLSLACVPEAQAWCDEDCAYEAHEAAYERAVELQGAREDGDDEGYAIQDRRALRSQRSEKSAEPSAPPTQRRVAAPRSEPTPAVEKPRPPPRSKVAIESSSIATGATKVAEDDSGGREVVRRDVGCKTFFPSVGMTLSVRCD